MRVSLLALGSGTAATLTQQGLDLLLQAQCIVGAPRLLEQLPDNCTERRFAATKPQQILDILRRENREQAAVVYSGDTGFYSGSSHLAPLLEEAQISYTVCAGISSVQLLAAALHRPWQDWVLVSAHGVSCDAVAAVMQGRPAFFLTGGSFGVPQICMQLKQAGLGTLPVTVGENLGYPTGQITTGTAAEMVEHRFGPLCVLLTEAAPQPPLRSPGWPDDWFVRGKVPMTKRFVRAAAVAALGPKPGETVWDVGAGTGSVSVELAAAGKGNHVYAVECETAALELIRRNREKFCAWNLQVVEGRAPQALAALPAPDAVFVGGSKGEMEAILSVVWTKNPAARLCISCIALETLAAVGNICQKRGVPFEVKQLAVSETCPRGGLHLMMAQNPVYLVTVHCDD